MKQTITINNIPSIIWGDDSDRIIIAIHGNQSNKADVPIEILANTASIKGYQVLSFDLPQHGDRVNESTLCEVQTCIKELQIIMQYAKTNWKYVSLFANSIGAYFSLLAYLDEPLEKVFFLSPVVNMQRIIENMMIAFSITEEQLEQQRIISTPIGQYLYWDYYCFVKEHPIIKWSVPTYILYGDSDDLCEYNLLCQFADRFSCKLNIANETGHYFHTQANLNVLSNWLKEVL
ncbi:alpha/beta hydrolase [Parabacteroides segnis]|uniref:alpha/beta hydrolase n=1 Tax=Parabacteroides segnis TaxID=2763058 RepID=UPI0035114B86